MCTDSSIVVRVVSMVYVLLMSPPEYLTIEEAAELCRVSRRTVTSWLQKELITKYVAPNGYNVRVQRAEIEAFDAARRTAPTVPDEGEVAVSDRFLG